MALRVRSLSVVWAVSFSALCLLQMSSSDPARLHNIRHRQLVAPESENLNPRHPLMPGG